MAPPSTAAAVEGREARLDRLHRAGEQRYEAVADEELQGSTVPRHDAAEDLADDAHGRYRPRPRSHPSAGYSWTPRRVALRSNDACARSPPRGHGGSRP